MSTITGQQKYVVINPCSSARKNNWRNWPEDRYAEVIDYLHIKHYQVILTGGPAAMEIEFGQRIGALAKTPVIDMIGKTSLGELLALLSNATFIIAPDTGPAHMGNCSRYTRYRFIREQQILRAPAPIKVSMFW